MYPGQGQPGDSGPAGARGAKVLLLLSKSVLISKKKPSKTLQQEMCCLV